MKNLVYILIVVLSISCNYDDDGNIFTPNEGTDFEQDISDFTHFNLSTPVELKVLDKDLTGSNDLEYKLGDTLKLALEIDEIHQENRVDKYHIYKSTGAEFYEYHINTNHLIEFRSLKVVDLSLIDEFPEIKNLSDIEIRKDPIFKHLFLNPNELLAQYNTNSKKYISKVGIVLDRELNVWFQEFSYSNRATNYTSDKNISISIPIISELDNGLKRIIVTE